jgi:two-component system sensor histidine kinase KdpD
MAVRRVRAVFGVDAEIFFPEGSGGLRSLAAADRTVIGDPRELAIARWAFDHGQPAGHGTHTLSGSPVRFLPLVGTTVGGVLGVGLGHREEALTPAQVQLLDTFTAQTAVALERARLAEQAAAARVAAETEQTRSALLSAVSHDLRTPLASIAGSAEALLESPGPLSEIDRRNLLETVRDEARRLARLVSDLLDLTRIESGALRAKREWVPLEEVIGASLDSLEREYDLRRVKVSLPDDLLWVQADPILLQDVLLNLIENALKYSPGSAEVEVTAHPAGDDGTVIEVADRGAGIPPDEQERIFERFYRAEDGKRARGTGLGLTVARAIVEAHGGELWVEAREGGGSVFKVGLPQEGGGPEVSA